MPKDAPTVYAVYRRLSPAHGWSLACTADQKKVADSLAESEQAYQAAQGFATAETKAVAYESYADVLPSVD